MNRTLSQDKIKALTALFGEVQTKYCKQKLKHVPLTVKGYVDDLVSLEDYVVNGVAGEADNDHFDNLKKKHLFDYYQIKDELKNVS